ncbi:ABC-ATPase domain-containing protein [Nitrospira defluvii]|nr:ABC-ATPase domain-containing protein [Nitrospira defluvii]
MRTNKDLVRHLDRIDGRGYKAYKEIKGQYTFPEYTLYIDHVQGDPFAAPSRFRVEIPQTITQFPDDLIRTPIRRIALADYLTRQFYGEARKRSERCGTGNSGLLEIDRPKQEVLERSSASVDDKRVELRFFVGLPARGRTILGRQAIRIIDEILPVIIDRALQYKNLNASLVRTFVETIEDAESIRNALGERRLVSFVADGAILPRHSGIDAHPLNRGAVPFRHPPSMSVTFVRPNQGPITGMGIPYGVTLIVGGGYHGKSTLLRAIEYGIYNHVPGDGREFVITDSDVVKVRAEDQRGIAGVDISPFIGHLPKGRSTTEFSTENASGSTSQAANIIEALEVGARGFLIDEDTAATNFMIRDHRMQELIAKEQEPITPFIDRVRQLYHDYKVSTVLVIGGSGDYFDVADTVIAMDHFIPSDVTERAKQIANQYKSQRKSEGGGKFGAIRHRIPISESLDPRGKSRAVHLKAFDIETIAFGNEKINLSAVEQLVEKSQVRAIAHAMTYAKQKYMNNRSTLSEIADKIMRDISEKGLDAVTDEKFGDLAAFRRFEWVAAVNRLRTLRVKPANQGN